MSEYIEAHRRASEALHAGKIKAYATKHCRERGRLIEVMTDQGWSPDPVYEEFPPENRAQAVPAIGQHVSVRGIDGAILVGEVTGHDMKDGAPIFAYEYDHLLPDGSLVKHKKWAWPKQVLMNGQLT